MSTVDLPRGGPENPMSDQDLESKFMDQASEVISGESAACIRDKLGRLESLANVSQLMTFASVRNEIVRPALLR